MFDGLTACVFCAIDHLLPPLALAMDRPIIAFSGYQVHLLTWIPQTERPHTATRAL